MKLDLNFSNKNLDTGHIAKVISRVWQRMHMFLFFFLLLVAIFIGGYIWRQNVYLGSWSDEKKQEYLNMQNKEVIFKEDAFQKVISNMALRKEELSKTYQPVKDIFKSYK